MGKSFRKRRLERGCGVIQRRIGRWTVYDYTGEVHPEIMKFMSNEMLIPRTENNNFLLDTESWYSITPADLAASISQGILNMYRRPVNILDLFSGVGGNTASFLQYGNCVDSVEFDYRKIKCLRNNMKACGVSANHRVFYSDVYSPELLPRLREKYDVLMASPPWGGLCYKRDSGYAMFKKCRVLELEAIYKEKASLRIYMVPRQIPDAVFLLLNEQFLVFNGITFFITDRIVAKILVVGDIDNFSLDYVEY